MVRGEGIVLPALLRRTIKTEVRTRSSRTGSKWDADKKRWVPCTHDIESQQQKTDLLQTSIKTATASAKE